MNPPALPAKHTPCHAGSNIPVTEPHGAPATAQSVLSSQTLMQGRKAVSITHNGTTYRLQATRLGKLILTK